MRENDEKRMLFKGVHGEEILDCGCTVMHYFGGKTIVKASNLCTNIPRHRDKITYVCGVCGKETNKKRLKIHKEKDHAL